MFRNRVHEQCPNGDSETLPSQKTWSKTKPGARAPNWPSPRAHAQRPTRPRLCPTPACTPHALLPESLLRAPLGPLPPAHAPTPTPQRLCAPTACAPQGYACAPQHSARAPQFPACACCGPSAPQRLLPARLLAVSWLGWALYRNTVQPCLCSTVAIQSIVLRYNLPTAKLPAI